MSCRLRTTLLLSLALGCDGQVSAGGQTALIGVVPNVLTFGVATPIDVEGQGLYVEVITDFTAPAGIRIQDRFSGDLDGYPLEQLRWVSNSELRAVVPDGLLLGTHDLRIVTPNGRIVSLEGAVTVVDSTGAGGDCRPTDPPAEICDGLNNDCDPASVDGDEDPLLGAPCDGPDSDLCLDDTYTGCALGVLVCSSGANNLDLCNGLDDDCDLTTPDGFDEATYNDPCDGTDSDQCAEGVIACDGTMLYCTDTTGDNLEGPAGNVTCSDSNDNDCDGLFDASDPGCDPICPWLNMAYGYRRPLTISNGSPDPVGIGYTVTFTLDHATLVAAGKSRVDGDDLRLVFCDGAGGITELDRVDESVFATPDGSASFGTNQAELSFRTTVGIPSTGADTGHFLYYGAPSAGPPPQDPANVYDFWEPFDDISRWTVMGTPGESVVGGILGLDTLSTDGADLLYLNDPKGDRDSSAGFGLRAKTKQLELFDDLNALGWYLDTATGARYGIVSKTFENRIREALSWGANGNLQVSDSGANPPLADTWYVYEATVDGQSFAFWRNGLRLLTASDNSLFGGKIHFSGELVRCRWDWLLLRLYVNPEPTVSIGLEETL